MNLTLSLLRPVEEKNLLFHGDRLADLVSDPVGGDGDLRNDG